MCTERDDNSTDEIEITSAMIKAGVDEFVAFACEPFPGMHSEEAVCEIFKAMVAAARESADLGPTDRP